MDFERIITLIDKVSSSEVKRFCLEEGNLKIEITNKKRKNKNGIGPVVKVPIPKAAMEEHKTETVPSEKTDLPDGKQVKAPLVGTFYQAASPEAEAFVKPGDAVQKGQVLGIIEAMKLMNEIECEYDGVLEAVLVENEQMVEYGQPLFVIR